MVEWAPDARVFARITSTLAWLTSLDSRTLDLVSALTVEDEFVSSAGGGSYGGTRRIRCDGRVVQSGDEGDGEDASMLVDDISATGVLSGNIICISSISGDRYLQYAESGVPANTYFSGWFSCFYSRRCTKM
jgi:hypothetical protein